jgi:hypothetical protein
MLNTIEMIAYPPKRVRKLRTASPFGLFHFLTYFGGQGTEADQGVDETGAETTHKKPIRAQKAESSQYCHP